MEKKPDVDLYEELDKELAKSKEEESSGASATKPKEEDGKKKEEAIKPDENAELSEEEISQLSPRAQKRIRELAEKVKTLAEKPAEKSPEEPAKDKPKAESDYKNVEEFLAAVEDTDSRNLLEKFYKVVKGEISTTLSPVESANNTARFNEEFAKYETIEGLSEHKSDLLKTFMRDPSQSVKSLIGDVVTDIQLHKIKPVEDAPSDPKRDGEINTDGMSTDQLYDLLESSKGQ